MSKSNVFQDIDRVCSDLSTKCTAQFSRFDSSTSMQNVLVVVSIKSATETLLLSRKLRELHFVHDITLHSIGDHCCVDCYWRGSFSLFDYLARLKRCGQSITSLIRSALSLETDQVCVVSVQVLPIRQQFSTQIQPNLVLICCTNTDENLLRELGGIHLLHDAYLQFTPDMLTPSRHVKGSDTVFSLSPTKSSIEPKFQDVTLSSLLSTRNIHLKPPPGLGLGGSITQLSETTRKIYLFWDLGERFQTLTERSC